MVAQNVTQALPGRRTPVLSEPCWHEVVGNRVGEMPKGSEVAYFAMGCFWGAEKLFWNTPGVTSTAVGYTGGLTPHPTYREVCSGLTGHAETVMVAYDPARVGYRDLLAVFFENHDPTQGMRQGNDHGTQYRSAIYTADETQAALAREVAARFQPELSAAGYGAITTEIKPAGPFYLAEDYHQQYLVKNPNGYCPVHATGVRCSAAG
ncbi:MAG: peptide-methionine (S)-S-oxide reductase MsrA [Propionibacteriaceae bacterium]|nr:peptide-methionine (S)-S-oxide reductase MsrA [Propionibacteriaceae bacterium]